MKSKGLSESLKNAFNGLWHCFRHERNFKIHTAAAIAVAVLCFVLEIYGLELIAVVSAVFFVMAAEAFNTAIEAMCDAVTLENNKFIKIAKDCSAAAVLLSAIYSLIVAAIIILPRIPFVKR